MDKSAVLKFHDVTGPVLRALVEIQILMQIQT